LHALTAIACIFPLKNSAASCHVPGTVQKHPNKTFVILIEGRASATPSIDLLITLLSWGVSGYKKLLADRKEMFTYLQQKLAACAQQCGERLLNTRRNPISMGKADLFTRMIWTYFACLHFQHMKNKTKK